MCINTILDRQVLLLMLVALADHLVDRDILIYKKRTAAYVSLPKIALGHKRISPKPYSSDLCSIRTIYIRYCIYSKLIGSDTWY